MVKLSLALSIFWQTIGFKGFWAPLLIEINEYWPFLWVLGSKAKYVLNDVHLVCTFWTAKPTFS